MPDDPLVSPGGALGQSWTGVIVAGAAFAAAAMAVDGAVAALGWFGTTGSSGSGGRIEVPGWVVGSVWVLLFALMGAAWRVSVAATDRPAKPGGGWPVVALAAFCLAYPFYTDGLRSRELGLAGDIATLVAAAVVVLGLWRRGSPAAALLVLPTLAWVGFATYTLL